MSLALQCSECGRTIHSTALSGVCTHCLVSSTRGGLGRSSGPPGERLYAGRTVGPQDRFLLLRKIGRGGMGEIWLANDEHLSRGSEPRPVALKFLSEEIRTNTRALELLRDEVARSQMLNHPNIVRIHDMHATADGTPFIKMEYVEGDSLAHWLSASGEPMPWRMACELGAQVASALEYAHRAAKLVHRDVKPSNILIGKGPTAKLTDFGIAQVLQEIEQELEEWEPMGTLAYASPEQIQGRPPSPADDVYALGATLYELLTGTAPSEASTTEALRAHTIYSVPESVNARLQRLGKIERAPSDLVSLVSKCLSKQPADRPTMKRVAAVLGQLPALTEETAPAPEKQSWLQPVALAALLVAGFAVYKMEWLKKVETKAPPDAVAQSESAPLESIIEPQDPISTEPVAAVPQATAPPPVEQKPSPEPGALRVFLEPSRQEPKLIELFRDSLLVRSDELIGRRQAALFTSLEPDEYRLRIAVGAARVESVVRIQSGSTNYPVFFFGAKDVEIQCNAPNTSVRWKVEGPDPYSDPVEATFSGTARAFIVVRRFETEVSYRFLFQSRGYRDVVTNLTFSGQNRASFAINLPRKNAPEFGPGAPRFWTNSIGMVFRKIENLWVCTTETTVGQFRAFVEATGHDMSEGMYSMGFDGRKQAGFSWRNPGYAQTDAHPVIGVSEGDTRAFCDWLTQAKEGSLDPGQIYRLPTTNDWLKFSGAGAYPWGSGSEVAGNFAGREVLRARPPWPKGFPLLDHYEDTWPRTAPVQAQPGANDLFFIAGNVAERCQGGFVCGGSWFDGETVDLDGDGRSAVEDALNTLVTSYLIQSVRPEERDDRYGFRVVISEGSAPR